MILTPIKEEEAFASHRIKTHRQRLCYLKKGKHHRQLRAGDTKNHPERKSTKATSELNAQADNDSSSSDAFFRAANRPDSPQIKPSKPLALLHQAKTNQHRQHTKGRRRGNRWTHHSVIHRKVPGETSAAIPPNYKPATPMTDATAAGIKDCPFRSRAQASGSKSACKAISVKPNRRPDSLITLQRIRTSTGP